MAKITRVNLSFEQPKCTDGDTFFRVNLTQAEPGTEICKGVKGLTFERCNLRNCVVPPDADVIQCNKVQKPFCTNARPDLVDKVKTPCAENCEHRSAEQEWVDIDERELKKYVDDNTISPGTAPQTKVVDNKDEYGVATQQMQKLVYTYETKAIKSYE